MHVRIQYHQELPRKRKDGPRDRYTLALGAAFGGIGGKQLFNFIKSHSANPAFVGGVQALSLALATFLTLIYTLKSDQIRTKKIRSKTVCVLIGLVLGFMSSFMGIGGGPFNLAVLSYFFSMGTKEAAKDDQLQTNHGTYCTGDGLDDGFSSEDIAHQNQNTNQNSRVRQKLVD